MARYSPFPINLDPVKKLPVRTAVAVLVTVVLFKYLFSCPCVSPEETALHCWLYLLLPVGIMFFMLLLMDTQLLKLCQCFVCKCCVRGDRRCCSARLECCCCADGYCYRPATCGEEAWYPCTLIGKHVLRVMYAAGLWVVVAFLDGDWYVCIRTVVVNGTGEQLACKELPTKEEAETLRKYDSESRIIGLFFILGFSFLLTVSSFIRIRWKPYYRSLFEVYLEQETVAMLEEKLHQQAVEKAKVLSEHVSHCVQNQHENNDQGDGHHCQYQLLTQTEENMWRTISHPAFHLLGVRIHP
ncbi:uncharacterized protein LOC134324754 [Trichomycterus rosablanca]|uniref:uncharacterized protein LOC134324754 n=1 Tax=Trichomycterus rosablanca TaxID=2290929 RepID=UPI002F35E62C